MSGTRIPLAIAFVLGVLLSVVNVSAFNRAGVTSRASATVVNTNDAALAVAANSPMATVQANGILKIDFRVGTIQYAQTVGGAAPVSMPEDSFNMWDVIRVTNRTARAQCVAVYVSSGAPAQLAAIYGRYPSQTVPGGQLMAGGGGAEAGRLLLGASGSATSEARIDFYWAGGAMAASAMPFELKVRGTASGGTCP